MWHDKKNAREAAGQNATSTQIEASAQNAASTQSTASTRSAGETPDQAPQTLTASQPTAASQPAAAPQPAADSQIHTLSCKDLSVGYNGKAVLDDITLEVSSGEVLCLLGPNGVGKSTLFKTLLGLLPKISGEIFSDGQHTSKLTRREFARKVAYVPQTHSLAFPYSVVDMVLTGSLSHMGLFRNPTAEQYQHAEKILKDLDIYKLKSRPFTQLSGGEQQMTLIARALMQDANIVLMDEPTAALDIANQVNVLKAVDRLGQTGHGVIMITHDPDQCFLSATKVLLIMHSGRVLFGDVDEIVTEANLKEAYGIETRIVQTTDEDGRPLHACIPLLSQ